MRFLTAIADHGTFTRAAEALHMAQPPLSQQVKRLEDDFGVRIFDRSGRGAALTSAGDVLVERARAILSLAKEFETLARALGAGDQGHLRVGMAGGVSLLPLIPAAISAFRREKPSVTVTLEESNTPALCASLRLGQVDMAIVRPPVFDADIVVRPLIDEPSVIALPDTHPRATAKGLYLREIAEDPLILFERHLGPGFYDTIISACLQSGFSPQLGQSAPQVAATIPMVAAGMGVTIVPAYLQQIHAQGVTFHPILGDTPRATIAMATTRAIPSKAAIAFETLLKKLCASCDGKTVGTCRI